MAVDTGYYGGCGSGGSEDRPMFPRSAGVPLFTPHSPLDQTLSPLMTIAPGEAVIVDVYNMPPARSIQTMRILLGCYDLATHGPLCQPCGTPPLGREPVVLASKPMDLGEPANWVFTDTKTQMVIMLPGVYQFELSDEDMLGDGFYMEYRTWPAAATLSLPAAYQGGM